MLEGTTTLHVTNGLCATLQLLKHLLLSAFAFSSALVFLVPMEGGVHLNPTWRR